MQIVSNGDNLHEMSNPAFWENKNKKHQRVVCRISQFWCSSNLQNNEPTHDKTYNRICAAIVDSDHPANPRINENPCDTECKNRLIWVFVGHTDLTVGFVVCWHKHVSGPERLSFLISEIFLQKQRQSQNCNKTKQGGLTLKAPSKICSRRRSEICIFFFLFFFSKKTSLDISCESSAWQTIHMKYQDLFTSENKKKKKKYKF